VQSKIKALRELDARVLTTEEISVMIAKRNKGKGDVLSFINDRRRLREARETALMNDDEVAIARIDQELQDLEDRNKAGTNARVETQMQRMARLNAENRKRNMAEIRQAEIAEKRAARLALQEAEQGGGSFANPFMRVKTAVKFRHDIHGDELAVKKDSANGSPKSTTTTITATTTDVVDNTKAVGNTKENRGVGVMNGAGLPKGRKRGGVDDVIASMDLGIEIDI
jgi:RNA polymerase-associated protein RTF1